MLDSGESKNPATHACACTSCTYLVLSCRLLGRDIARGRRHGPALGRVAADARTRARARVVLLPLVARLVLLVLVLLVDVRTEGDHCLPVNCGYDCTGVLEGVVVVVMTGVLTVVLTVREGCLGDIRLYHGIDKLRRSPPRFLSDCHFAATQDESSSPPPPHCYPSSAPGRAHVDQQREYAARRPPRSSPSWPAALASPVARRRTDSTPIDALLIKQGPRVWP